MFVIWGPLVVPNNKVPTNTQCKPVGYDCNLPFVNGLVLFGLEPRSQCLTQNGPMSQHLWNACRSRKEYSQFLPAKDSMKRICSTQEEHHHHHSCHFNLLKHHTITHVMSSLVQRCFFRKNKGKHICCKKCQRFGMHNLTLIYFPFCGSIKKFIFFYAAIKFQKIFLWFHKKIKIYKLFFYGSTK